MHNTSEKTKVTEYIYSIGALVGIIAGLVIIWAVGMWIIDTAPMLALSAFLFGCGFAVGYNSK